MTSPLHESCLLWIHDPHHNQPPRVTPRQTVIPEKHDTVPRNNQQTVPRNNQQTVPRNNQRTVPRDKVVKHSDASTRAPLENIPSSSWYNSNLSSDSNSRSSVCNSVPRTNIQRNNETNSVCKQAVSSSLPPKRKGIVNIERRGVREREERSEAFIHDASWASQRPGDPSSSSIPVQVTQSGLQDSDPISAMRPAVYHPLESVGSPLTNDNSPFQIDLESGEFSGLHPGLYKPTDPDPQHDTWAFSPAAYSSDKDLPHLPGLLRRAARIPGPGQGYTPFSHAVASQTSVSRWKPPCPSQQPFYDLTCVSHRVRLPQVLHAPTSDSVAKGDANALQRYTAQPNAHLHGGIGVTLYTQSDKL